MPAYNFQPNFAEDIRSGKKKQTIRKRRKRGNPKPGGRLFLFTGQRTKKCKRLGIYVCSDVLPIEIGYHKRDGVRLYWIKIDGYHVHR